MPGPAPKSATTRRRRNKVAGAATLTLAHNVTAPELPDCRVNGWHPQTLEWWADVWASPMAPEYDGSDRHGLFLLAVLIDDFWWEPTKDLAAEIRLQRQCFGLTPIDRRRLQWEIERAEDAEQKTEERRRNSRQKPPAAKAVDPRRHLASTTTAKRSAAK